MSILNKNILLVSIVSSLLGQDSTKMIIGKQIGPILNDLPVLDSLIIVNKDSSSMALKQSTPIAKAPSYPINASGTFFRGLEISSQGTGMLNGGLRFQIAGKLNDQIRVSGIVTDETLPIQPDGTTASLDELDKIFLKVSHPSGELLAGDITITNKSGKYNRGNKNIVGITNNINKDNVTVSTTFGQSKGKYNRLEIKGRDGHQGPYFLTSNDGMRNVIISAGSESVWLNGIEMKRGQDRDYIIDYTSGELIFTPKHLIYFDSDIDIEYQYNESTYKSNYLETDISGNFNEKINYNLTYMNEKDNTIGSVLTGDQISAFKSIDVVYQSGVTQDSLGDYELIQDIYYYSPNSISSNNRYIVTFSIDPQGLYVRKISMQNRIYYEFIGSSDADDNIVRYSPGRTLKAPESHQQLQFNSNINFRKGTSLFAESAFTMQNSNILSKGPDAQSNGNALRIGLDQSQFNIGKVDMSYNIEYWQNSEGFKNLTRDREVNFNESWDISKQNEDTHESMLSLMSRFNLGQELKSKIQLSRFEQNNIQKDRQELNLDYYGKFLKTAKLRLNQVQSEIDFQEVNGKLIFLKGFANPFISYGHEMREKEYRFDDMLIGINYSKSYWFSSIGLGKRNDYIFLKENNYLMEEAKSGQYVQMDIKSSNSSGWRHAWVYRQRIQKNNKDRNQESFNSLRGSVNYRTKNSPLKMDLILNAQNALHETRAIIYDSLGIGLGNYRYDPALNEYIQDENGAYISHTVFTGEHQAGFRMDGLTRLLVDLSKTNNVKLNPFMYRFLHRLDFHGPIYGWRGSLSKNGVQLYQSTQRHEIIHREKGQSSRHRLWYENRSYFGGLDPRGWEKRLYAKSVGESQVFIKNSKYLIFRGDLHNSNVTSENNRIIDRSISGFTSEFGLKENKIGRFQWDSRLIYYKDKIILEDHEAMNVSAYGLKTSWLRFIGKDGRLEGNIDYFFADGSSKMPPESLNGIANGKTIKANLTASILLGRSLSLNGTIFYLDNLRYSEFFKIQGEIRAHF